MTIVKNSVVSITCKLSDTKGNVLEETERAISYLHGGYDNIFPRWKNKSWKNVGVP